MGSPISTSEGRARTRQLAEASAPVEPASQSIVLTDAQLLRRANTELELLYAVEQLIASAEDMNELLAGVLDRMASHMSFEGASLLLLNGGDGELCSVLRGQAATRRTLPRTAALQWLEQARGRSTRTVDTTDEKSAESLLGDKPRAHLLTVYNAPVASGGGQAGVLQLVAPQELTEADDVVLRRLGLVAAQVGRAIMLRRERDEMLRGERMSQLGRSLDTILHDLHAPLMAVAGYVEIMASADEQEVRREYAERTGRGLEHVERMVRELLSYARGQREVAVGPVNLTRFISETRELLEPELQRFGASLEVQVAYQGSARFDAHKIKRALFNLARNAGQAGAKLLTWSIARESEYLVLECSDTGPGIAAERLPRLFDASDVDAKPQGLGLGLSIVKAIVDAHRGRISVKSDLGHGTVFRIELPF